MVADWLPALLLGALLLGATWTDARTRRIPNKLVLAGTLLGLGLHLVLPRGASLFAAPVGSIGIVFALGGWALGLALLLPFYALRMFGAGDVKLMAMVGAWIGPAPVAGATLLTMIAGGVLAIATALLTGKLGRVLGNVRNMLERMVIARLSGAGLDVPAAPPGTGKLAYAFAISCGTAAQLWLAGSPAWHMFS